MESNREDRRQEMGADERRLERALGELDAFQRDAWQADLDLREQAKSDPALARIIADADAEYEATHGEPWVNPLCK